MNYSTVEDKTGVIYMRVSSAAFNRDGWFHELPEFIRFYWDARPEVFREINR